MTPERWEQVKDIVYRALELAPDARGPFVESACAADEELRREVASLLETHGQGEAFLETERAPAAPWAAGEPTTVRERRFAEGEIDPAARVGTLLDGLYTIEALVGTGGMGAVYRARHVVLGDPVAIKVLKGEFAAHPELLKRFRREGQAARRFKHPNAVAVYDLRTSTDGTTYMVLEYVDGRTLRAEIEARGTLDPEEAVGLVEQIASVLDAAHEKGVVHRDLKPENVMIAEGGDGRAVAKLLDLGIAKVGPPPAVPDAAVLSTELTLPGQIMGTPHYMSPEQWWTPQRDGVEGVDARSDVYSLGVVAYELVAGRRPFSGATLHDLRRDHVTRRPARLDALSGVPQAFADAVERALAKDRADRHASAGEFASALRRALGTAPAARTNAETTGTARSRWVLPVACAVALAAAATVWILSRPAEAPPAPAPAAATPAPRLSYVVEVERSPKGPTDTTSAPAVRAGQAFKFRFAPSEPGFLYVVAPGAGNVPETLLTARPLAETGVDTNLAAGGGEFEFPRTADFWLAIRDDAPETRYTVVFSPKPLAEPPFLAEAAGRRLSPDEQRAFERFRSRHAGEAKVADGRVVVSGAPGAPLVFDIPVTLTGNPRIHTKAHE
jgi:serine/threonine protein kinase